MLQLMKLSDQLFLQLKIPDLNTAPENHEPVHKGINKVLKSNNYK